MPDTRTAQDCGARCKPRLKFQLQLIAALLATALSACSTLRPTMPPAAPVRTVWRNSPPIPASGATEWTDRWWEQIGSPQLNTLVNTALRDNPGLAASRERLIAARALEAAASGLYKPVLALGSGSEATPGVRSSYFQAGLDANWELPLFERRENGAKILESQSTAVRAGIAEAQNALIAEAVLLYLDGSIAAYQVDVSARLVEVAEARQQRTAARISAGLDELGAHQTSLQHSREAQADLRQDQMMRARSLEGLAALTGQAQPDADWLPAQAALPPLPAPAASVPRDLLRQRPDVRVAEAAVVKAAGELG
ncbi:MAG: TolC family protein, partial [Pseudomonadota bacterium]